MQLDEIDKNKTCCLNCKWFEERTGFCRCNPPQVLALFVKGLGDITSSAFPKISMPHIDWCKSFDNKNEKSLV